MGTKYLLILGVPPRTKSRSYNCGRNSTGARVESGVESAGASIKTSSSPRQRSLQGKTVCTSVSIAGMPSRYPEVSMRTRCLVYCAHFKLNSSRTKVHALVLHM
eukprot:1821393-Pleurochrysis_carterae.AAC.1